jgi:hypothetical protein
MKGSLLIIFFAIALYSCNSSPSKVKTVPGAGSEHLYELMDEDSTAQKADTPSAP